MPREGQETTHETPTLTLGNKQSSLNKRTLARAPLLSSYREVPTLVIAIPTRHTSSTPSQLHTIYSTTLPLASPLRDPTTRVAITRQRLTFPTTLPLASPLRDPRNTNTMQWMAHTM